MVVCQCVCVCLWYLLAFIGLIIIVVINKAMLSMTASESQARKFACWFYIIMCIISIHMYKRL